MKLLPHILMTAAAVLAVLAAIVWAMNQYLPPSKHDLHDRMRAASQPTSGDVMQIRLAHIGHIVTPDGRFEVATQFDALKGMLSAHEVRWLVIFTPEGELVAKYSMSMGLPSWCEGSRLHLEGVTSAGRFRMDPVIEAEEPEDSMPVGNVIDFSAGLADPLVTEDASHAADRRADIARYNASLLPH